MDIDKAIEILSNFDMQVTDKEDGAYQSMIGEKACKYAVEALEELQQYHQIGTIDECKTAREKQRPKKPITYKGTNIADCPVCGNTVRGIKKPFGDYCSKCGQAIDWGGRKMSMTTELVKKLRRYAKAYTESPLGREVDGTKELLRKAAYTIEELSLKLHNSQMERSSMHYNGGWILCDERMPEEHESMFAKFKGTERWINGMAEKISDDVNVTVEYENGARKVKTLHTCDGKWKVENSLLKFKVIAWQPLPPKYEPEED